MVQVNVQAVQETPSGSQSQQGLGSGVIYRKDGYIITNEHVVRDASEVNVAFADGSTAQGEVVGADRRSDIAVIGVDRQGLPAAKFEADGRVLVGELAVAIGSPSGFQSTVTAGVVSGLNREISPQITGGPSQLPSLTGLIQTDAAISPGNSGGALVNREAEVTGINEAYVPQTPSGAPAEGLGFAIPAETATSVADQIIETGEVAYPYLGVVPIDLTPEVARQYNLPVEQGVNRAGGTGRPGGRGGPEKQRHRHRHRLHRDKGLRRPVQRPARLPAGRPGQPYRAKRRRRGDHRRDPWRVTRVRRCPRVGQTR